MTTKWYMELTTRQAPWIDIEELEKRMPFTTFKNILINKIIPEKNFKKNMCNIGNKKRVTFTNKMNHEILGFKRNENNHAFPCWLAIWKYKLTIKCKNWYEVFNDVDLFGVAENSYDFEYQDPNVNHDIHCCCGKQHGISRSIDVKNEEGFIIPIGYYCATKTTRDLKKLYMEQNEKSIERDEKIKKCDNLAEGFKKADKKNKTKGDFKKNKPKFLENLSNKKNLTNFVGKAFSKNKKNRHKDEKDEKDEKELINCFIDLLKYDLYPIVDNGDVILTNNPTTIFNCTKKIKETIYNYKNSLYNIENHEYSKQRYKAYKFHEIFTKWLIHNSDIANCVWITITKPTKSRVLEKMYEYFKNVYRCIYKIFYGEIPKNYDRQTELREEINRAKKLNNSIDYNKITKFLEEYDEISEEEDNEEVQEGYEESKE